MNCISCGRNDLTGFKCVCGWERIIRRPASCGSWWIYNDRKSEGKTVERSGWSAVPEGSMIVVDDVEKL